MSTTTQPTVTAIRVSTNNDSLFDGNMSTAELASIDQVATRRKYSDLLSLEIAKDYPQARITITDATVYRTTVSIDTSGDSDKDEDVQFMCFGLQEEVALRVDEAAAHVWESGGSWIENE